MKKLLFFAIALMFAFASCTNEALNEVVEEPIVPESTAAPVLYASFESNEIESKAGFTYDGAGHYDHYWNAGDHIYVFNKNNEYDIYNCTDASAGAFSLVKDRTDGSAVSKVYAVYYSTLTDNDNRIDDPGFLNLYTSPSLHMSAYIDWEYSVAGADKNGAYGYNNLMVAAADNTDEKLVFKSAFGWLKLQLKGTQKVKSITVHSVWDNILDYNNTSTVNVGNLTGTPETGFDYYDTKDRRLNIDAPYAQLNNTTATDFYITLPPCTMSKGFQVTIKFDDNTTQTLNTSEKSYQIKRNTVTTLPEVILNTEDYTNLSSSERANTYIVQSSGLYCFNGTKKGNSNESVGTPVRAGVLWESFNTTTVPNVGDVVNGLTLQNGVVYFNVPFTNKGNAVIAVYDSSDNILWSWLIWVNDIDGLTTPVDLTSYASGLRMMKASLGSTEMAGVPLYYQWGRKDPFYRYATYNVAGYIEGSVHPTALYSGTVSVANSIKNPLTLYYGASSYMWDNDLTPAERVELWKEGTKTIYDPCPPGWKVMNASTFKTAILNGLNSGLFGFGYWGSLISFTTGELMGGSSAHWTSNAYLDGGNFRVDYVNHNAGNYAISQDVFTSLAYPVRCQKQ